MWLGSQWVRPGAYLLYVRIEYHAANNATGEFNKQSKNCAFAKPLANTQFKSHVIFPYVGIIQIRLWVKAIQLTLSPLQRGLPLNMFLLYNDVQKMQPLSKDYCADSLHVLHIHSLNFFCVRGTALLNDDGFVVQSDGVIASGADTVWRGGTDKNYSINVQTA